MSRFVSALVTQRTGPKTAMLLVPLIYESDLIGLVEVPAGFSTDFASVPRLPVAYMLTGDTAHEAAVVHDFLYSTKRVSRSKADAVFLEAMETLGMSWWRRRLMWLGVRVGGWGSY